MYLQPAQDFVCDTRICKTLNIMKLNNPYDIFTKHLWMACGCAKFNFTVFISMFFSLIFGRVTHGFVSRI